MFSLLKQSRFAQAIVACTSLAVAVIAAQTSVALAAGAVPAAYFAATVDGNCSGGICDPSGAFPLAGGISLGTLGKVGFYGWQYIEPSCDGGTNPSSTCYHWGQVTPWVNYAQAHGMKMIYDLDNVPGWMCSQSPFCTVLPSNLTLVSNFATALATKFKGQIQYYETLNEIDAPGAWTGTCADLVLLHNTIRDAIKAADPNAVVGAPNMTGYSTPGTACDSSPVNAGTNSVLWIQNFLQTHDRNGSLPRVDTVGIHTYEIVQPALHNVAQRFLDGYNQLRSVMTAAGIPTSAPLLVTEGSFGPDSNNNCSSPLSSTACLTSTQQPAYVGRWLVLGASTWADGGGELPSWYAYDLDWGTLNGSSGMNPQNASAYGQMESWLTGATFSQQCRAGTPSTVFVCDFTNGTGRQSEVIFNDNNGATATYTAPSWATTYQPLLGSAQAISGGSVTVGDTPILLSTNTTADTTAPSTPTGLSATAASTSQINLSWTASTDNVGVTGYKIYRGGVQIATTAGTSYQNTGLTANTTYSYAVAAYDAAGNVSGQSGSASATTFPSTALPANFFGASLFSSSFPLGGGMTIGTLGKVGGISGHWIEPTCDGGTDPNNACYSFSGLTSYVNKAQSNGLTIVYDFEYPGWMCGAGSSANCTTLPTNLTWLSNFATAIATKYKGQIKYYETGNEVNNNPDWTDTCANLVLENNTIYNAIKAVDPTAIVGAPNLAAYNGTFTGGGACVGSPVAAGNSASIWVNNFLQTTDSLGQKAKVDTIGVHTYASQVYTSPDGCDWSNNILHCAAAPLLHLYNSFRTVMTNNGIASAPLLVTEGGFGVDNDSSPGAYACSTNPNNLTACMTNTQQAAYVGRWLVLSASTWADGNGQLANWYAYDIDWGTLNGSNGMNPQNSSAYGQMESWIKGATFSQQCHTGSPSTLWVCDFTNSSGTQSEIVFNDNIGATTAYAPPSWAIAYQPLLGSKASVTGSITVGDTPILLSTNTTADTTPPSIPTNLTATAVSTSQINLAWTASTDNVGVTGYKIYRGGTQIATTANTSYSNTGLTASTNYSYTVSAYDAAGNNSAQSTSVSATTQSSVSLVRINAGSTTSYTDTKGNVWSADQFATGGVTYANTNTVTNTTAPQIYQTERYGNAASFAYNIPVANGTYNVNLDFAETLFTGPGQRIFSVSINGTQVLTNFDIYAAAGGMNIAVVKTFSTTVTNGTINVTFTPGSADNPKVNGIEVLAQTTAASVYDSAVLTDNPAVYWPLGDASGFTNRASTTLALTAFNSPTVSTLPNGDSATVFNGTTQYLEAPDNDIVSVPTTGILTMEAWMRPDVLTFPKSEGSGYVHWMGKGVGSGSTGQEEYVSRMYNATTTDSPSRPNRISGYSFNLSGGLGAGSYFQDPVTAGAWIHYVFVINTNNTSSIYTTGYTKIYKNGVLRGQNALSDYSIIPGNGTAPFRVGTRDFASYFEGAVGKVAIYNYELTAGQIQNHFNSMTVTGSADTTPPSTPTGLTATAVSASQINLAWTASTDNVGVTGYKIYRGGVQIATTASANYADTSLAASTSYTYSVAAYDAAGNNSGQSTSASATTQSTSNGISVQKFTLYNASPSPTTAIQDITGNVTLTVTNPPANLFGLTAVTSPTTVGSVVFTVTGGTNYTLSESVAPYSLCGDGGTTASEYPCAFLTTPGTYILTATPYSLANGTGTVGTSLTATITVTSTQPSTKFSIGNNVQVSSGPLNVRSAANTSSTILGTQATGALGTVIGGPTNANGYNWWNIDYVTGADGWSVEDYLVKYTDTSAPTTSITAPTAGATISGTASSLAATASDNIGVTKVELYVDGVLKGTDTAAPYAFSLDTTTLTNAIHSLTTKAYDAAGNVGTSAAVSVTVSNVVQNCISSNATWQNTSFTNQTGSFTAQFDATPSAAGSDMVMGLSSAAASAYTSLAAIARFNISGFIDAMNSTAYQAAASVSYTANQTFHFRMVVNIINHTYSAYVTPAGGTETQIANNYAFRSEQATVTSLANLGTYADIGGGTVCSLSVTAATSDTTAPSVPTNLTASAISSSQINLSWTASTDNVGVTGYMIYRGGTQIATTAGTSYADTGLTASTNYFYTVSAYDAAGNTSAQSGSASATTQSSSGSAIRVGGRVKTTANLNVRSQHNTSGNILCTQPLGSLGTVTAGPAGGSGYTWWNINFDTGCDGWSVQNYLVGL